MVSLRLVRSVSVVVLLAVVVGPAAGQTTVYNSNGFEPGTFTPGLVIGQQGFTATPVNLAGNIQTATTFAGSQAFQISGPSLVDNTTFAGGNFWYRTLPATSTGSFNPVANGTPIVQMQAQVRTSGAVPLVTDIPFAGLHLEGYSTGGLQQSITPLMVNLNGGLTVFTDTTTGGPNQAVSTANSLLPREAWNQLRIELNFNTTGPGAQTFRVFIQGQSTPVQFVTNGSGSAITPITDIPFRNTFGTTDRIAELGMIGFYGRDTGGGPVQPLNNFFIDDFQVTAAPVPEPGWLVAIGFVGTAAGRWWRRRRAG